MYIVGPYVGLFIYKLGNWHIHVQFGTITDGSAYLLTSRESKHFIDFTQKQC